ncbi:hypothetical protein HFN78_14245 [Rhizobium laguerreae]|uniref:hypothetical protein n=1 Tax=Rhizobium laguerreae TaxID=1076926 RepID=UPI001C9043F0|nr:hypothetical protein [Rhizobium laguerreae]MBY3472079.1 hypothetical protein [Rhizobium laguerreae]
MDDFIPSPRVSHHEAGHVVVGLLFGFIPDFVYAGSDGGVVYMQPPLPRAEDHSTLIILLAGMFAEGIPERCTFRPSDADIEARLSIEGQEGDLSRVLQSLVRRHPPETDRAFLDEYRSLEVITIELVARSDVRAAIRAVAAELMRAGRLSGAAAAEIATRYIVPGSLKMENTQ